jgi:hypothetical protein
MAWYDPRTWKPKTYAQIAAGPIGLMSLGAEKLIGGMVPPKVDFTDDEERRKKHAEALMGLLQGYRSRQAPNILNTYEQAKKRDISSDFGDTMSRYQNLMKAYAQRFGG